jgi:hypothetical protein
MLPGNRALNLRSLVDWTSIGKRASITVYAAASPYFHQVRSLIQDLAGPVFLRQLMRVMLEKPLMPAFSCVALKCTVNGVMRILVMCFLMDRSQPAFAIASIRHLWILSKTNRQIILAGAGGSTLSTYAATLHFALKSLAMMFIFQL